jgi:uncharacterized protein (TIGR02391 family)
MSNLIRERAGIDGDGAVLVGQALGGDLPKLKLNRLETESEKSVQKGFEQIIRGIYTGIRNPRSHDQITDQKQTADAVILFINYICKLLSESQEAFTVENFFTRIRDPEFVSSRRYAELIVEEIPKLRLGDALATIFKHRSLVDIKKLRILVDRMIAALSETQRSSYLSLVSEEFRTTTDEAEIRTGLQMLNSELWPSLAEIARLRIENKLIQGIKLGEIDEKGKVTQPLATWSREFLKTFTLKNEVADVLADKLYWPLPSHRRYVATYFMTVLPDVAYPGQKPSFVQALTDCVKEEDESMKRALISHVSSYPIEWQNDLAENLSDLTNPANPAAKLHDGRPFLSSPPNDMDDEIPF